MRYYRLTQSPSCPERTILIHQQVVPLQGLPQRLPFFSNNSDLPLQRMPRSTRDLLLLHGPSSILQRTELSSPLKALKHTACSNQYCAPLHHDAMSL